MIRGFWDPGFPLPLIQAAIWLDGLTDRWDLITFVIDTGSTHSCIHPLDARTFMGLSPAELDPAGWPDVESTDGIGGPSQYRKAGARYAFFDEREDAAPEFIDGASVQLAAMTPHSATLPSLLGWDVLSHFRLTIDSNEVWFERR